MKVFLACAKGMPDTDIQVLRKDVQRYLSMKNKQTVQVIPSSEDYKDYFANCGGWSEWINRIALGIDYTTRKQIYNAIVCANAELGRATANIVEKSVAAGKPVLYWDKKTETMKRVASVKTVDETNWQAGWALTFI
jgi:hypothetical protein